MVRIRNVQVLFSNSQILWGKTSYNLFTVVEMVPEESNFLMSLPVA